LFPIRQYCSVYLYAIFMWAWDRKDLNEPHPVSQRWQE
jgi:hypothetical protein